MSRLVASHAEPFVEQVPCGSVESAVRSARLAYVTDGEQRSLHYWWQAEATATIGWSSFRRRAALGGWTGARRRYWDDVAARVVSERAGQHAQEHLAELQALGALRQRILNHANGLAARSLEGAVNAAIALDRVADLASFGKLFHSARKGAEEIHLGNLGGWLKATGVEISPKLFAKVFAFTKAMEKRHPIKPNPAKRSKMYGEKGKEPTLSSIFEAGCPECAEIAAVAQGHLQGEGVRSRYFSGDVLWDRYASAWDRRAGCCLFLDRVTPLAGGQCSAGCIMNGSYADQRLSDSEARTLERLMVAPGKRVGLSDLQAINVTGKTAMCESDLVFPSVRGGFRSASVLDQPFRLVAEELRLGKRVTPRAMRRTFQDLARGAELRDIVTRAISGHATEAMKRRYSTVGADEIEAGIAKVVSLARVREAMVPTDDSGDATEAESDLGGVHGSENRKRSAGGSQN